MKTNQQYKLNKAASVHTIITCPICGKQFEKIQYSQAFCSTQCKDKFHNQKGDRHANPDYQHEYNIKHPERLERIGVYKDEYTGDLGYFDDENVFHTFKEDYEAEAFCENPILGI